jgi:hypothetical protein
MSKGSGHSDWKGQSSVLLSSIDDMGDMGDRLPARQSMALAIKALRGEDPNSLLALAAEWRLLSMVTKDVIEKEVPHGMDRKVGIAHCHVYAECSRQLEQLLEKRGHYI